MVSYDSYFVFLDITFQSETAILHSVSSKRYTSPKPILWTLSVLGCLRVKDKNCFICILWSTRRIGASAFCDKGLKEPYKSWSGPEDLIIYTACVLLIHGRDLHWQMAGDLRPKRWEPIYTGWHENNGPPSNTKYGLFLIILCKRYGGIGLGWV